MKKVKKSSRNAGKSKSLNIKKLQDDEELKQLKSMLEHDEDEADSESDSEGAISQDEGYASSGSRLSRADESRFGRNVLLPSNGRTSKESFKKTDGTKPILYSKSKFNKVSTVLLNIDNLSIF